MTSFPRLTTLLAMTLFPFAAVGATAADARAATGTARHCPFNLPQKNSVGTLVNGQTGIVVQWSLTCTGPLAAATNGGTLVLQVANGSGWNTVRRGASISMPSLGPGSYRLVIQNIGHSRISYNVGYRYGFG